MYFIVDYLLFERNVSLLAGGEWQHSSRI